MSDAPATVTDERIEAALAKTGITPELVEWYGNPDYRVTVRIETHIGYYAETWLTPWMDDEALVYYLERASRELEDRS
jgi:hypothetical protein